MELRMIRAVLPSIITIFENRDHDIGSYTVDSKRLVHPCRILQVFLLLLVGVGGW